MHTILLLEDDENLNRGIALTLKKAGYRVICAFCLAQAKERFDAEKERISLILCDITLPDGSGLEFGRLVRERSDIFLIYLTALDSEADMVSGYDAGADDYVTKPFSLAVLRARVHAQLRKRDAGRPQAVQIGEFTFDFSKMEFWKGERKLELSKTEQKLLKIFVENEGITLARARLVDRIWTDGADYVDENALSVTVRRLRGKLEDDPSKPEYIKTVYGIGYVWAAQADYDNNEEG